MQARLPSHVNHLSWDLPPQIADADGATLRHSTSFDQGDRRFPPCNFALTAALTDFALAGCTGSQKPTQVPDVVLGLASSTSTIWSVRVFHGMGCKLPMARIMFSWSAEAGQTYGSVDLRCKFMLCTRGPEVWPAGTCGSGGTRLRAVGDGEARLPEVVTDGSRHCRELHESPHAAREAFSVFHSVCSHIWPPTCARA